MKYKAEAGIYWYTIMKRPAWFPFWFDTGYRCAGESEAKRIINDLKAGFLK